MTLRKIISTCLSAFVLSTNCILGHAFETNFWMERQKSLQPQTLPPRPSSFRSASVDPKPADSFHALMRALPYLHGSVRDVSHPVTGPSKNVVVLVQDIHMDAEAQSNISSMLKALASRVSLDYVAMEGTAKTVDVTRYRRGVSPDAMASIADYLSKSGKISGAAHGLLTFDGQLPRMFGLENPALYSKNVAAYRRAAPLADHNKRRLSTIERQLTRKSADAMNRDLVAFEAVVREYHEGKVSLPSYLEAISARDVLSPSLKSFLSIAKIENEIDTGIVEKQRAELIFALSPRLTRAETSKLFEMGLAYRLSSISARDFYSELSRLAGEKGASLQKYPALERFVRYVAATDRLDGETLFAEIKDAEDRVYGLLAKTPLEKKLVGRMKLYRAARKLFSFSMTVDEWREYGRLKMEHSFPAFAALRSFEAFYEAAGDRDAAMSLRIVEKFGEKRASSGLVVAGGFHSQGMRRILNDAGFTTILFVPRLTRLPGHNESNYLTVFDQEKTPLEKLVMGEKIFLANDPVFGFPLIPRLDAALWKAWRADNPTVVMRDPIFGGAIETKVEVRPINQKVQKASEIISVESRVLRNPFARVFLWCLSWFASMPRGPVSNVARLTLEVLGDRLNMSGLIGEEPFGLSTVLPPGFNSPPEVTAITVEPNVTVDENGVAAVTAVALAADQDGDPITLYEWREGENVRARTTEPQANFQLFGVGDHRLTVTVFSEHTTEQGNVVVQEGSRDVVIAVAEAADEPRPADEDPGSGASPNDAPVANSSPAGPGRDDERDDGDSKKADPAKKILMPKPGDFSDGDFKSVSVESLRVDRNRTNRNGAARKPDYSNLSFSGTGVVEMPLQPYVGPPEQIDSPRPEPPKEKIPDTATKDPLSENESELVEAPRLDVRVRKSDAPVEIADDLPVADEIIDAPASSMSFRINWSGFLKTLSPLIVGAAAFSFWLFLPSKKSSKPNERKPDAPRRSKRWFFIATAIVVIPTFYVSGWFSSPPVPAPALPAPTVRMTASAPSVAIAPAVLMLEADKPEEKQDASRAPPVAPAPRAKPAEPASVDDGRREALKRDVARLKADLEKLENENKKGLAAGLVKELDENIGIVQDRVKSTAADVAARESGSRDLDRLEEEAETLRTEIKRLDASAVRAAVKDLKNKPPLYLPAMPVPVKNPDAGLLAQLSRLSPENKLNTIGMLKNLSTRKWDYMVKKENVGQLLRVKDLSPDQSKRFEQIIEREKFAPGDVVWEYDGVLFQAFLAVQLAANEDEIDRMSAAVDRLEAEKIKHERAIFEKSDLIEEKKAALKKSESAPRRLLEWRSVLRGLEQRKKSATSQADDAVRHERERIQKELKAAILAWEKPAERAAEPEAPVAVQKKIEDSSEIKKAEQKAADLDEEIAAVTADQNKYERFLLAQRKVEELEKKAAAIENLDELRSSLEKLKRQPLFVPKNPVPKKTVNADAAGEIRRMDPSGKEQYVGILYNLWSKNWTRPFHAGFANDVVRVQDLSADDQKRFAHHVAKLGPNALVCVYNNEIHLAFLMVELQTRDAEIAELTGKLERLEKRKRDLDNDLRIAREAETVLRGGLAVDPDRTPLENIVARKRELEEALRKQREEIVGLTRLQLAALKAPRLQVTIVPPPALPVPALPIEPEKVEEKPAEKNQGRLAENPQPQAEPVAPQELTWAGYALQATLAFAILFLLYQLIVLLSRREQTFSKSGIANPIDHSNAERGNRLAPIIQAIQAKAVLIDIKKKDRESGKPIYRLDRVQYTNSELGYQHQYRFRYHDAESAAKSKNAALVGYLQRQTTTKLNVGEGKIDKQSHDYKYDEKLQVVMREERKLNTFLGQFIRFESGKFSVHSPKNRERPTALMISDVDNNPLAVAVIAYLTGDHAYAFIFKKIGNETFEDIQRRIMAGEQSKLNLRFPLPKATDDLYRRIFNRVTDRLSVLTPASEEVTLYRPFNGDPNAHLQVGMNRKVPFEPGDPEENFFVFVVRENPAGYKPGSREVGVFRSRPFMDESGKITMREPLELSSSIDSLPDDKRILRPAPDPLNPEASYFEETWHWEFGADGAPVGRARVEKCEAVVEEVISIEEAEHREFTDEATVTRFTGSSPIDFDEENFSTEKAHVGKKGKKSRPPQTEVDETAALLRQVGRQLAADKSDGRSLVSLLGPEAKIGVGTLGKFAVPSLRSKNKEVLEEAIARLYVENDPVAAAAGIELQDILKKALTDPMQTMPLISHSGDPAAMAKWKTVVLPVTEKDAPLVNRLLARMPEQAQLFLAMDETAKPAYADLIGKNQRRVGVVTYRNSTTLFRSSSGRRFIDMDSFTEGLSRLLAGRRENYRVMLPSDVLFQNPSGSALRNDVFDQVEVGFCDESLNWVPASQLELNALLFAARVHLKQT